MFMAGPNNPSRWTAKKKQAKPRAVFHRCNFQLTITENKSGDHHYVGDFMPGKMIEMSDCFSG